MYPFHVAPSAPHEPQPETHPIQLVVRSNVLVKLHPGLIVLQFIRGVMV